MHDEILFPQRFAHAFFFGGLQSRGHRTARKQTTLVSSEMLAFGFKGRFSEILYQACRALPGMGEDSGQNGPVHRLLNWGSTSGTDTIVGFIMGKVMYLNFPQCEAPSRSAASYICLVILCKPTRKRTIYNPTFFHVAMIAIDGIANRVSVNHGNFINPNLASSEFSIPVSCAYNCCHRMVITTPETTTGRK